MSASDLNKKNLKINHPMTTKQTPPELKQPFESYPKLAGLLLHAANHWKTDDKWSETLAEINNLCRQHSAYNLDRETPGQGESVDDITERVYPPNPDCSREECYPNPCDKCKLRFDWFEYWTRADMNPLHRDWLCSYAVENNIPIPQQTNQYRERETPKLTEKVSYSDEAKAAMSNEEIVLVNMLADREPSCYADIADIIIEQTTSLKAEREELERVNAALIEAIKEIIESMEMQYQAECDDANWFNNNTPGIGQTIDYRSLPAKPKALEISQRTLKSIQK